MKRLCAILGLLLALTSAHAGTLYIGSEPTAKPRHLARAWKAVAAFDAAGVSENDAAIAGLIDAKVIERAVKARARLAAIETVVGWPDAVALAGAMEAGGGIVAVTVEDDGGCKNFTKAVQRAKTACAIVGAKVKSASVGKRRRFACKSKAGESLWGIEICE